MNADKTNDLFVCAECLTVGKRIKIVQGSWLIGVILYGCGLIPGIFYASWRESTRKYVCPGCKKDSMISLRTSKGRRLKLESETGNFDSSLFRIEKAVIPEKAETRNVNFTKPLIADEVFDDNVSVNSRPESVPNSMVTTNNIHTIVGFFVICGLILSTLMWWKWGSMDKERITKIDFRNHTYSSAGFVSEPVTLKNGKFLDHGDFGTHFNSVEYVDFNNDGENEAVVSIGTDIDGSAAYIEDYFVYSYQKGQLFKEIHHTAREETQQKK